jgi:ketosteroid isomerase-like protein
VTTSDRHETLAGFERRAALLRRMYAAFNRRDIEGALAALAADVDWPNMLDGVRANGPTEVRAYWGRQFGVISSQVEPLEIIERADESVVVAVHQVVRDVAVGELRSDTQIAHLFHFERDLVRSMQVYPSVEAALVAPLVAP